MVNFKGEMQNSPLFSLAAGRAAAVVTAIIRVDRVESLIVTCSVCLFNGNLE